MCTCRGQSRFSDPLKLKLQMTVNHLQVLGTTWILHRSDKCLNHWAITPARYIACSWMYLKCLYLACCPCTLQLCWACWLQEFSLASLGFIGERFDCQLRCAPQRSSFTEDRFVQALNFRDLVQSLLVYFFGPTMRQNIEVRVCGRAELFMEARK